MEVCFTHLNSVLSKDVIVLTILSNIRFPMLGGDGSGTAAAYLALPDNEEEAKVRGRQMVRTSPSQVIIRRGLSWAFHVAVALLALYGIASLISHPLLPITSLSRSAARTLSCNCGETVAEARANGCVYDSLAAAWLPPHCRSEAITAEFEMAGPCQYHSIFAIVFVFVPFLCPDLVLLIPELFGSSRHSPNNFPLSLKLPGFESVKLLTLAVPPDRWGNTWGYWADQNQSRALTVEEVSLLPEAARRGEPAHFFATHEWHVLHCVYYWRKMWESGKQQRGAADSQPLVIEKRYDTLMHIQHCMAMLAKKGVDPDSVAAEAGVALHSDEIHIAKPHRHENEMEKGGDPYDKSEMEGIGEGEGGEEVGMKHEHQDGNTKDPDPYDEDT